MCNQQWQQCTLEYPQSQDFQFHGICMSQFFGSMSSIHILIPNQTINSFNVLRAPGASIQQDGIDGCYSLFCKFQSWELLTCQRWARTPVHTHCFGRKTEAITPTVPESLLLSDRKNGCFPRVFIEQLIIIKHKWFTEYYTSQISQYKLTIDHNHPKSPCSRRKLDRSRPCGNKAAVVVLRQEVSQQLGSWSQTLSPLRLHLSLRILYMSRSESILILNDVKIFP